MKMDAIGRGVLPGRSQRGRKANQADESQRAENCHRVSPCSRQSGVGSVADTVDEFAISRKTRHHPSVMRSDLVLGALTRMGLLRAGESPPMAPLEGGVSSDIWRVELAGGPISVKRALPRLKRHSRNGWLLSSGTPTSGRVDGDRWRAFSPRRCRALVGA